MARTYATPAAVIVISTVFPALGIIVVFLRFYTRIKLGSSSMLWVDDWLTIPALIFELILAALLIWGAATKSLGDVLPPPSVPGPNGYLFSTSPRQIRLQQIQYFADIAAILAFGFIKLSILFFYRKIFCSPGISKTLFDIITWVVIVLVMVWTTAFGFGAIFLCGAHPANAWEPVAVVAEKCSAQLLLLEGYAISDFIMDFLIWSLPIPKILSLNMTMQQKIAVMAVFLIGLLATAASATRMGIYIRYVVNAFAQSDGETLITYLLFWTMIECGLGVIVISLPSLRPLYGAFLMNSILSGIRSMWSMRPLKKRWSQDSGDVGLYNLRSVNSNSLHSNFHAGKYDGNRNTYTVEAVHGSVRSYDGPQSGIHVKHEIEQY
ncbi:hypothetical protein ETB97_002379 [Aspergillus alliaceus]|uniref:Uncharacterized protein n=1 Tax=Petromyces alliaceus TaxID=209559 RepID=A0A5N6FLV0_PETAA|nr:uncharacterized protein BDW43DRAFT_287310 [Aspergillus alliaceus]KAB8229910.1 hypothetical protein BDW43DRAFT_287310 [Aspergillus alliaceus]KAF5859827.1 hypothetical protein ETB97_002379 [Aspergillus burnettii]